MNFRDFSMKDFYQRKTKENESCQATVLDSFLGCFPVSEVHRIWISFPVDQQFCSCKNSAKVVSDAEGDVGMCSELACSIDDCEGILDSQGTNKGAAPYSLLQKSDPKSSEAVSGFHTWRFLEDLHRMLKSKEL